MEEGYWYQGFRSEEDLKHRIKNALILLRDGHPLNVGSLLLGADDKNRFNVSGFAEFESAQKALIDLEGVKTLFARFIDISDELRDFTKDRDMYYYLLYHYGMGSSLICGEEDGKLIWGADFFKV
jgi:hypothetical protein